MIHHWAQATDATRAAVRVVLFDYKKEFDLIDHQILIQKIFCLNISQSNARWIADFLKNTNPFLHSVAPEQQSLLKELKFQI